MRNRARLSVVALTLAKHAPVFAVLYGPPAIWAAVAGQGALAVHLAWPAMVGLAAFGAVWRRSLPRDLHAVEAMASLAAVFFLGAAGAVPAFMVLGMPPVDALFEGMSGLTTTGLSVARAPDTWPFAAHVLRSWLQWVGGLVMATAVLALILPAGVPTRRLGQVGIDQGDRISSTRAKARQLLGVYLALTVGFIAVAVPVLPDWREAMVLVLSGISTGGFAPRSDSLGSYGALGQTVVMLSCVAGAISFLTFVLLLRGNLREAWAIGSLRRVGVAIALLAGALLAVRALGVQDGRDGAYGVVLDLVSALTTAGYSTGAMPMGGATLILFFVAMGLGADTGSTGGGLKLARLGLMLRAARHNLRAPSLPESAVAPLRQDGETVGEKQIVAALALVFIYLAAMLALWGHFALHGYPLPLALFETISALSTVGLSTGVVGADLPWDLKLSLTFAMWLGRLEFIAVLVLLLPRTWIKGA